MKSKEKVVPNFTSCFLHNQESRNGAVSQKRESWFFLAFGGIWGLLLSLFMKLKVNLERHAWSANTPPLSYMLAFGSSF